MKIRVEFDPAPIRHIAVQCPDCKSWFKGCEMTKDNLHYDDDIYSAVFTCPICQKSYSANLSGGFSFSQDKYEEYLEKCRIEIEEVPYPEVYKDCKKKRIIWE